MLFVVILLNHKVAVPWGFVCQYFLNFLAISTSLAYFAMEEEEKSYILTAFVLKGCYSPDGVREDKRGWLHRSFTYFLRFSQETSTAVVIGLLYLAVTLYRPLNSLIRCIASTPDQVCMSVCLSQELVGDG